MRMYCEGFVKKPIDALEKTLDMRIMFPTCPDTLRCYPSSVEDPFILDSAPHVYFAGNQPRFETREVKLPDSKHTIIICVPCFRSTREVVLVSLKNLKAQYFRFDCSELLPQPADIS